MASFEARYEGRCPAGDDIEPGDTVNYDPNDILWHTQCLTEENERERRLAARETTICTECWLVQPCEHTEESRQS